MMPTAARDTALDPPAVQAWSHLEHRVEGVRTRHRAKFLGTGLCFGLAVFAAAFLGFAAADIVFKLSVGSRVFALLSTVIGIAAVFFWCVIRPWTRLGGAVRVARAVEGAYPQLEEQLSTALEYGRDPALSEKTSSPALVGALLQQAAERSDPLDFSRTIRWKQLGIAALAALLLAFALGGYAAWDRRLFKLTAARFLRPTAAIAPPTLTVITRVEPEDAGTREFPVESSVPVTVDLAGRLPDTATLSVFIPDGGAGVSPASVSPADQNGRWEDRVMDRGDDNRYRATLRRLLDNTRYRIRAGDAESPEYLIEVYRIPEISEFALRLEHPAYTCRASETLAPGVGDVRALKGSIVHVELKANTDLSAAKVAFKSGRAEIPATPDAADRRKATASFKVEADDEYQLHIANLKNKTGVSSLYQVKALKDKPPKVVIRKPDKDQKDVMVHRTQTVEVEIAADDDVGVAEIGIFHSIGLDEQKVMVRRLDLPSPRTDGKLRWELGNLGLKGGEVIAYYAYATDADTVTGPKMAKSDIQFLTVYDEQEYDNPQNPKKPPGTPEAVKQLDKLIDVQKKLLKETFAQARQREAAQPQPVTDSEKAAARKTADGQEKLRGQVQDLLDKVKAELENAPPQPEEQPADNPDGPKPPQQPGLGEKEIKHIETAIERMGRAETALKVPETPKAVRPETEALRHLSETRRLLLSDKEGDPRFKMAMDKQSKKNRQKERSQQEKDQEEAKQELAEMPKMLEREKQLERELEELNLRKKNNPPPPPDQRQTDEQKKEQDEQRRLQREKQQQLEQLARDAEERARKLEQLAARNPDMQPAADKMQQAAEKLDKAAEEAKQQAEKNTREAQAQTHEAQNNTRDAQRDLRNALEKQIRQELANLQKDAQELAQRQQDLAQQAQQLQKEQQQGPQQSQQQQGQQQAQQQQGQQPQQAQNQQGQQQGPTTAQRLGVMAKDQRDIKDGLKDLAQRIEKAAPEAAAKELAGAQALDQARQQAAENGPASQSAQKSQDAMEAAKQAEAQRESAQAAKAMEQLAATLREAAQKTTAGDMKALAAAMKKLQGLAKEQSDINKDLASAKRDAAPLAQREEQVSSGAKEVADAADKLETLRRQGRQGAAKEKLDDAAKQADKAAQSLKNQDAAAAKAPGEKTEQSLNQALTEMERAAGKTLEEKARDAREIARAARDKQEKAAATANEIPPPKPGDKLAPADASKRDDAAAKEHQAARDAKRLDHALDGLQEMAKDANPAAAEAAREARETTEKAELPKAMEDLAKGVEQIGEKPADPKAAPKLTPQQAAQRGEELAQVVRNVEKNLDAFIAEANNSQLDRLKAMETAAREAAQKAQNLAENKPDNQAKPKPDESKAPKEGQPNSQQPANSPKPIADSQQPIANSQPAAADQLAKDLQRLEPKLQRLEPNAPELVKMRDARAELDKAREELKKQKTPPNGTPAAGLTNAGGPTFKRVADKLDDVAGGLLNRIERLIRAREIKPDEDEDAPKEYRALVDKYYRALSEDVEEEKK